MTDSLETRTALVTGAGRGIGRATAVGLARAGAVVALVARSHDQLAQTATLIRELNGTALVIPADLGDDAGLAQAIGQARGELGEIDILINNAAVVWPLGPSASVDTGDWAAAIRINVVAAATLTFAFLPGMLERGWGRIVNVSSSVVGRPQAMIGGNAYVAGKAALEAHTVNLAAELDGSGVTVNVFRPGSVDTAMQAWIRDQDPARIGAPLHERFSRSYAQGTLISAERSAQSMLARLGGDSSGQIWDVSDPG